MKLNVSLCNFLIACYDEALIYTFCIECWAYLSFRFHVCVSNMVFKFWSFQTMLIVSCLMQLWRTEFELDGINSGS